MRIDRARLRLRLALYALAVGVLLYLCLAPSRSLPSVDVSDKIEHSLAWAVLAGSGFILFPGRTWRIVGFALALGALIEVLQAVMPLGRDGEIMDWVADSLGVAVALGVWAVVRRLRR